MQLWLLLLALAPAAAFHQECASGTELCVPITECSDFESSRIILTTCGFRGRKPRICCRVATEVSTTGPAVPETRAPDVTPPATIPDMKPPEITNSSSISLLNLAFLPDECGNPERILQKFVLKAPETPTPCDLSPEDQAAGRRCQAGATGGFEATPGKWPWMALFGEKLESGVLGHWFCGGTLITDRHVLTAAHCLRPQQAASVGVRLGDHDLSFDAEVDHQERNIAWIRRHPDYRGAQNDIALVRLTEPVVLTDAVRPICLPPAGSEHHGRDVEMAGWGRLGFDAKPSDILQEVPLRVSDEADCEHAHSQVPSFSFRFPGGFQGTKVCALSRDGEPRDACPGDSGGPLMAEVMAAAPQLPARYELVGVVSTGVGCGNQAFPGIYTKVSRYIDWIVQNLE